MKNYFRKVLSFSLALAMLVGVFSAAVPVDVHADSMVTVPIALYLDVDEGNETEVVVSLSRTDVEAVDSQTITVDGKIDKTIELTLNTMDASGDYVIKVEQTELIKPDYDVIIAGDAVAYSTIKGSEYNEEGFGFGRLSIESPFIATTDADGNPVLADEHTAYFDRETRTTVLKIPEKDLKSVISQKGRQSITVNGVYSKPDYTCYLKVEKPEYPIGDGLAFDFLLYYKKPIVINRLDDYVRVRQPLEKRILAFAGDAKHYNVDSDFDDYDFRIFADGKDEYKIGVHSEEDVYLGLWFKTDREHSKRVLGNEAIAVQTDERDAMTESLTDLMASNQDYEDIYAGDGGDLVIRIQPRMVEVVFEADGGSPEPETQVIKAGSKAIRPETDPEKVGYKFVGWYYVESDDSISQAVDFDKEKVYSSKYRAVYEKLDEKVEYFTVEFDAKGGEPNPYSQAVKAGDMVEEPDKNPVKEGYSFIGWTTAKGDWDFDKDVVERNMILYAKYDDDSDDTNRSDIIVPKGTYDKAIIQYKAPFFKGYPDNTFKPEDTITRAEMATVFARLLGVEKEIPKTKDKFSDIDGHWAKNNILNVAEYGLLNGYPDGTFKPVGQMKRAEIAAIINKYWKIKGFTPNKADANIKDVDAHWAKELIIALYNHRFVDLSSDKKFRPDYPLKRAEVAQILNRITDRPLISLKEPMFKDVLKNNWAYEEVNTASTKSKK